jgi:hypothetical protein
MFVSRFQPRKMKLQKREVVNVIRSLLSNYKIYVVSGFHRTFWELSWIIITVKAVYQQLSFRLYEKRWTREKAIKLGRSWNYTATTREHTLPSWDQHRSPKQDKLIFLHLAPTAKISFVPRHAPLRFLTSFWPLINVFFLRYRKPKAKYSTVKRFLLRVAVDQTKERETNYVSSYPIHSYRIRGAQVGNQHDPTKDEFIWLRTYTLCASFILLRIEHFLLNKEKLIKFPFMVKKRRCATSKFTRSGIHREHIEARRRGEASVEM